MTLDELERRLASIEDRLTRVERQDSGNRGRVWPAAGNTAEAVAENVSRMAATARAPGGDVLNADVSGETPPQRAPSTTSISEPTSASSTLPRSNHTGTTQASASLATSLLGWGGAIAMVLAAAYLIRLAVDTGWLTPARQVAFAGLGGIALIAAGFAVRRHDRAYAGLLPAAGVGILYLTVYGAHLYYQLIDADSAAAAITVICAISLALYRLFDGDLYAFFAVAGSYSAPFLLATYRGSLGELALYFSAWSVVFSTFAIWHGRRQVYLLALYFALIGFDLVARESETVQWLPALLYQTAQFLIFGIAATLFSIRRATPMTPAAAHAHLPALLLFYFLQYTLLKAHLPEAAPWISIASLAAMLLLYAAARTFLRRPLPGGEVLLWFYAALVLFHAGYIETVPAGLAPWIALFVVLLFAVVRLRGRDNPASWPMWLAVGLMFLANLLSILFDHGLQSVPGRPYLGIAYAALLYAGYAFCRDYASLRRVELPLLYLGHVTAMVTALHLFHEQIIQSVAWALLALACLGWSSLRRDRLLGQSSLMIFAATAIKVLLYDLRDSPPLARIISLAVLGLTFYAAGMLYQRVAAAAQPAEE